MRDFFGASELSESSHRALHIDKQKYFIGDATISISDLNLEVPQQYTL